MHQCLINLFWYSFWIPIWKERRAIRNSSKYLIHLFIWSNKILIVDLKIVSLKSTGRAKKICILLLLTAVISRSVKIFLVHPVVTVTKIHLYKNSKNGIISCYLPKSNIQIYMCYTEVVLKLEKYQGNKNNIIFEKFKNRLKFTKFDVHIQRILTSNWSIL